MIKLWIKLQCRLGKVVNITSRGKYPANVLSNFWGNSFKIDGIECKSMEGFLQSLKHQDVDKQRQICSMKGGKAKHQGTNTWKIKQQVYWHGKAMGRQSNEFYHLIYKAYCAMFEQSVSFHDALMLTRGKKLFHASGVNNPLDTILTRDEFCRVLTEMREKEIVATNSLLGKKIVYVDMDNVLVDFQSGIDALSEEIKKEYEGRLDEVPGFFADLKPMPGAVEALHELVQHYEVYILSTAPWENPSAWSDKVKWVTKYLDDICHKRLILSHHKNLNEGDYLIDDRGKNGASEFGGEWIQFGSEKFPDWESVVRWFERA